MQFDWSISIGNILTVASALIIVAGILYRRGGFDTEVKTAVNMLTKDLGEMKEEMRTFAISLRELAVQRVEINLLMKWYDELRRGVGQIVDKD